MSMVPEAVRKDLAALALLHERSIGFSDLPAVQAKGGISAEHRQFYRPLKQQLTVRIDADVVQWLKSQGKGYQSRLNDILRTAMLEAANHSSPDNTAYETTAVGQQPAHQTGETKGAA